MTLTKHHIKANWSIISLLAVLLILTAIYGWYHTLLLIKIPTSLVGYSRSFYGVYLFIALLPIVLLLPTFKNSTRLFTIIILLYTSLTLLIEYHVRIPQSIKIQENILIFSNYEISADSIDNMHITKLPLGIAYRHLNKFITLPQGDTGMPYAQLLDTQLTIILILAQIITIFMTVKAICVTKQSRILLAFLGVGLTKHIFDGGFLSPSGLPLLVIFILLINTVNSKVNLNLTAMINTILTTFFVSLLFSIIIKAFIFNEPNWQDVVLERQLVACGIVGITLFIYALLNRLWILSLLSVGFCLPGLLVSPILFHDLKYAYRLFQPGQLLSVVNSPEKTVEYLQLKKHTFGYEIYSKYNLKPGFDWVSVVSPDCATDFVEFNFKVRGEFSVTQYDPSVLITTKKCDSSEWCTHFVNAKISRCIATQNGFPEVVKNLILARQPIYIRDILRTRNFDCH